MKVLMIGPALQMKGGIASVGQTLVAASKQSGCEMRYVASYVDGPKLRKAAAAAAGLGRMLLELLRFRPDIVHIHSASRGSFRRKYLYFMLARLFRQRVLYHIHGAEFLLYFQEAGTAERRRIQHVLSRADRVIALSRRWQEDLQSIAPAAKIELVYNPVDMRAFTHEKEKAPPVSILFMGRLGKRKGIYDLLAVIPALVRKYPHVRFQLCGDGDVEQVQRIVREQALEPYVEVPGWINGEQKLAYLRQAAIYVLPSYHEGLPISILEAMASALPVVATTVGGIPEAVGHGENGCLLAPGDQDSLQHYLEQLIASPQLRGQYGARSLAKCREQFDITVVRKRLMEIYETLLEGRE